MMSDPFHTSIDGGELARKRERIERERAAAAAEFDAAADALEERECHEEQPGYQKAIRLLREEAARWRQ